MMDIQTSGAQFYLASAYILDVVSLYEVVAGGSSKKDARNVCLVVGKEIHFQVSRSRT